MIPNGVYVDAFAAAVPDERWRGTPQAPTIAFLGRLDEPRKGLEVLAAAAPRVLERYPGARFLVAGRGDAGRDAAIEALGSHAGSFEFLGGVSDEEKGALLASADLYVAPQTGGESFGIVLVEAMSAGTGVVASDLGAFRRVLDDGTAGLLFRTGEADELARALLGALDDPAGTAARKERASSFVQRFDWTAVTEQVLAVYEMAVAAGDALGSEEALAAVARDERAGGRRVRRTAGGEGA